VIVGIGLDLVRVERFRRAGERRGERFLSRIFTALEIEEGRMDPEPWPLHAARFAVKEAVMKALGTGWTRGIGFSEIEVECSGGAPTRVTLRGRALTEAKRAGATRVHASLSRHGDLAAALVILERAG
jgi:holo-[acyl-carrier protein] synthase